MIGDTEHEVNRKVSRVTSPLVFDSALIRRTSLYAVTDQLCLYQAFPLMGIEADIVGVTKIRLILTA